MNTAQAFLDERREARRRLILAASVSLVIHGGLLAAMLAPSSMRPSGPIVVEPIPVEFVVEAPRAVRATLPILAMPPAPPSPTALAPAVAPDPASLSSVSADAAPLRAAPLDVTPLQAAAEAAPLAAVNAPPPERLAPVADRLDLAAAGPIAASGPTPIPIPQALAAVPPLDALAAAGGPGSQQEAAAGGPSRLEEAPPPSLAMAAPSPSLAPTRLESTPGAPLQPSPPEALAAPAPATGLVAAPPDRSSSRPSALRSPPPQMAAAPLAPLEALRPSDPRPAIAAAIAGLDCARVGAEVDEFTQAVTVAGHARSPADKARLAQTLAALPGIRRVDDAALRIVGEPHCRLLALLDRPEFQRSSEQRDDLASIGAAIQPGLRQLLGGEALDLTLKSPGFEAYLTVDYFSGDGQVAHLLTSSQAGDRLGANTSFKLGPGGRGRSGVAGPPYGLDIVVVIAASEPILQAARPVVEEAQSYLRLVEAEVERVRMRAPRSRFEYAYYLVSTAPRAAQVRGSGAAAASR